MMFRSVILSTITLHETRTSNQGEEIGVELRRMKVDLFLTLSLKKYTIVFAT